MFELRYDAALGLLRGRVRTGFSVADVQEESARALAAIERCRAEHGDVKMLIVSDREMPLDPQVVREAQRARAAILTGPYDRIALVFPTSLFKAAMAQSLESEKEKAFLSENAALTWLMADRLARGLAA